MSADFRAYLVPSCTGPSGMQLLRDSERDYIVIGLRTETRDYIVIGLRTERPRIRDSDCRRTNRLFSSRECPDRFCSPHNLLLSGSQWLFPCGEEARA
jgi:hypothetical protein